MPVTTTREFGIGVGVFDTQINGAPALDLLDSCDVALAGMDYQALSDGFGETSPLSCEDVYFANLALSRTLVGGKRIR